MRVRDVREKRAGGLKGPLSLFCNRFKEGGNTGPTDPGPAIESVGVGQRGEREGGKEGEGGRGREGGSE